MTPGVPGTRIHSILRYPRYGTPRRLSRSVLRLSVLTIGRFIRTVKNSPSDLAGEIAVFDFPIYNHCVFEQKLAVSVPTRRHDPYPDA